MPLATALPVAQRPRLWPRPLRQTILLDQLPAIQIRSHLCVWRSRQRHRYPSFRCGNSPPCAPRSARLARRRCRPKIRLSSASTPPEHIAATVRLFSASLTLNAAVGLLVREVT